MCEPVSQLFHVTVPWRLYNGDWVIYNHDDPLHMRYRSALSYFNFCHGPIMSCCTSHSKSAALYNQTLYCESIALF